MGKFNGFLKAEFHPPKNWTLTDELVYTADVACNAIGWIGDLPITVSVSGNSTQISAPKGFDTNLASVPKMLWWFLAPWDVARAAVIHDYLYTAIEMYLKRYPNTSHEYRKNLKTDADNVFKLAMTDAKPSVPPYKIYLAHKAVCLFGGIAIKGYFGSTKETEK